MKLVSSPLRAQAQGPRRVPGGVRWNLWAPKHREAWLLVGQGPSRRRLPMRPGEDGCFWLELPAVPAGERYAYQFGASPLELPDPASRWQPDGVHRPSAVYFPEDFPWQDAAWRGLALDDLVIYELHVGTFTPAGTLQAIIPRLPQLRELGATAIELMPLSPFPGTRNWGYDGVHPYAVQESYGGPRGLQELVDAAHAAGLGVILDVVYNHLGPEGNYLAQFGPYFTSAYHTPWGEAPNYDGPQSDQVRRYMIDSACQWIREFHIDGLRLDAVQTIYDMSAYHFLAELQAEVQATAAQCGRSALVIAETNQNDARLTAPVEQGGYGLDAVWNDDLHHCVHAVLTGERDGYYVDYGAPEQLAKAYREMFVHDGSWSPYFQRRHGSRVAGQPRQRFVVSLQTHDQVGNRAFGERIASLLPLAGQRLAAALVLLSPGTPMLFMGEEYGETNPFCYFCSFGDPALVEAVRLGRAREFARFALHSAEGIPDPHAPALFEQAQLSWQWEDDPGRSGLRRLYQTLLAARQTWPGLIDRQHCTARIVREAPGGPLVVLERGQPGDLLAVANLSPEPARLPADLPAGLPRLLSTEETRFGGQSAERAANELAPHELVIWGRSAPPAGSA